MKTTGTILAVRVCVLAVRGALAAVALMPLAHAGEPENEEVQALVQPTSKVELGLGEVNKASSKFGEYNGLGQGGAFGIGAFDVRGKERYDGESALRWSVTGRDLGLSTRAIEGEVGVQGQFRLNFGYDQLPRNYAGDYQTFYDGAGSTALTLPASFAATPAAQRLSSTTTVNNALSNWQNIQSPYASAACAATGGVPSAPCRGPGYLIPAAMHGFEVGTERERRNAGFTVMLMPGLELSASANSEQKQGSKLTGVAYGGPARGVLAPEPINSTTKQFRAGLSYVADNWHASLAYYGSFYSNAVDLWTVENPFNGALLNAAFNNAARLPGAPDNEMQRFSLAGGYSFSSTTHLSVAGNYQSMTQDKAFITGLPSTWTIPVTSAQAKVLNTSFNATLSSRPLPALSLGAVYKYENRDSQTPIVDFLVAGGDAAGNPSRFTNEPLNRRMEQFSLDADYTLARRQSLRLGLDWQAIRRSADGEETPFRAETTHENTVRLDYRNNVSPELTGRIGLSRQERRHSEYEDNNLLPVPTVAPLPAADPLLPGFEQYFLAKRSRTQLRSSLNYQPNEVLNLQGGLDLNKDTYKDLDYGLKSSQSWVFKLDAGIAASEKLSYNLFYTYEDRKSQLDSLVIGRGSTATLLDAPASTPGSSCVGYFAASGHLPSDEGSDPCRAWTERQSDKVHTFGLSTRADKLMGGKLDLSVDVAYARSRTPIDVTGGAYFGNGNATKTTAVPYNNIYIAATALPDITNNMLDLRLNGVYRLSKVAAIRAGYQFRRVQASDWQYDAYTNSALGVLAIPVYPGNNMRAPNYSVQMLSVSYVHSF
ncbi:MAG: MtrB/PioB family decaheme-associated outer membrane protein [Pseudomonadota bacterium]